MEKTEKKRYKFGLVGKNISYSFSRGYFTEKFKKLNLPTHTYENFDFQNIEEFKMLMEDKEVIGVNVTIPYKQEVIPYLTEVHPKAKKIGAVNTIKFSKNGIIGYNTDAYGFRESLRPYIQPHHKKALILGTGGASKAVAFVLEELNMAYSYVSRTPKAAQLTYKDIDHTVIKEHTVIINCTPLGTHPNVTNKPDIAYEAIGKEHLLYDLIYNPAKTAFLLEGESRGAAICNGLRMLELQAEKAWEVWTSPLKN